HDAVRAGIAQRAQSGPVVGEGILGGGSGDYDDARIRAARELHEALDQRSIERAAPRNEERAGGRTRDGGGWRCCALCGGARGDHRTAEEERTAHQRTPTAPLTDSMSFTGS